MTKKIIMVVDDDTDNSFSLKTGLEDIDPNYEVICANSGKQCFELIKQNKIPDLFLLDIMMPEMTGWEILKILRETPACKQIPVVFLTARTDTVAKKAGNFLADDYIEKPYDITSLKKKIDVLLKVA